MSDVIPALYGRNVQPTQLILYVMIYLTVTVFKRHVRYCTGSRAILARGRAALDGLAGNFADARLHALLSSATSSALRGIASQLKRVEY